MATPRVVIVHRATEYEELLDRHGTRGQVEFFLRTRGQTLGALDERHERAHDALREVGAAIDLDWRRASVERGELPRFGFEPDDIVVAVGQDGLVANLAKYVGAQPIIGINPLPEANAGVLVPHSPRRAGALLARVAGGQARMIDRTMVSVTSDDGQTLVALNEVFIGQPGHQSARYEIVVEGGVRERQSSSGVIVGTGTGASGWCRSLHRIQAPSLSLPKPTDPTLTWFVREPWPSPVTGADLVAGTIADGGELRMRVESDSLVAFGDGIESDRVHLSWGQQATVCRAPRVLRTVA
ncbi:MAG: hypothetical protein V9G15_05870 [Dermatophilaceae bacterium]|nr:NAD(+)/NADH kinase [Actinomycetales bacterium]